MAKTSTAHEEKLVARFDEVRDRLLQDRYADRLGRPLEFWVLPSDRRLPLALLGRTLHDLLTTPFDELSATPGIGEKKIHSLVKLLDRATSDEPPTVAVGEAEADAEQLAERRSLDVFDPSVVSEALWTEWRGIVRQFGLEAWELGYLAPSLQRLPTVIWHKPLGDYLDHSLAEIRRLRTHGEKRVRCVLEVFHSVYHRLLSLPSDTNLEEQLTPVHIAEASAWVAASQRKQTLPDDVEIREGFVQPLIAQLLVDCGETVTRLVEERLGLQGPPRSVREQARSLAVTRARVYQLLDDCGKVIAVRWPGGRTLLNQLTGHFSQLEQRSGDLRVFFSICELCFPEKQIDGRHATLAVERLADQELVEGAPELPMPDDGARNGSRDLANQEVDASGAEGSVEGDGTGARRSTGDAPRRRDSDHEPPATDPASRSTYSRAFHEPANAAAERTGNRSGSKASY